MYINIKYIDIKLFELYKKRHKNLLNFPLSKGVSKIRFFLSMPETYIFPHYKLTNQGRTMVE